MNKGDTISFILDYTLNGEPLEKDAYDVIEFAIGEKIFKTTDNKIVWDDEKGKYVINLTQEESFELPNIVKHQIRIKTNGEVVSSPIETLRLGNTISKEILWITLYLSMEK